ncbi:MAG: glycoside hydrolase family 2 protein [Opitutae bacterium]|nr:glycoside hydrolase family 2 protein [Opitutae bacterium]
MLHSKLLRLRLAAAFFLLVGVTIASARERYAWDAQWKFHLGDAPGAAAADFDDAAWRKLDLPHDWSIALPLDKDAPSAGHGGFFQNGIGWYRKTFRAAKSWRGQLVTLEFDGVMMNAEVFVNGVAVGKHAHGFTPFTVDLTPHLKLAAENVVAVRVDHSAQPTARFYTGAGIYRHVTLHVSAPVRVAADGVLAVTSALSSTEATLAVETTLANATAAERKISAEISIFDVAGKRVAQVKTPATVASGTESRVSTTVKVAQPQPWSPATPTLYRAVVRLTDGNELLDDYSTLFGIRTLRWSAERGLELNGAPIKLNGGNVHHDTGILGAAAFDRAEERKVELLKAEGFNAVRTAHNPPSRAFLDACDRLGLLVMDEIFDGWAKAKTKHDYHELFVAEWSRDVEAWVKRDRNHPSVAIWSIGNEMFERTSAEGQRIARELADRVRTLDPTRPVSAGVNGAGKGGKWEQLDPLFASLDIAGYNYELAAQHTNDHARLPNRIMMATESYQTEVFANWTIAQAQPHVVGDFVWSALDYLGEAGIGRVYLPDEPALKHWEGNMWPWHGAACGDVDLIGGRKPISHYRNIVWDRGEKLYAAVIAPTPDGRPWNVTPWSLPPTLPSWTWPGGEGRALSVEVYSRHERVRLELNGRSLGERPTDRAHEFRAVFNVPYAPGELVAIGLDGDGEAERFTLRTAGKPVELRVTPDRTRLRPGGQDLLYLTIEAVDANGVWVPNADQLVTVEVSGAATLLALGNADLTSKEPYLGPKRSLFQGRALAVVRSREKGGEVAVRVSAPKLKPATLNLRAAAR